MCGTFYRLGGSLIISVKVPKQKEIVKPVSRARALRPMTICPSYSSFLSFHVPFFSSSSSRVCVAATPGKGEPVSVDETSVCAERRSIDVTIYTVQHLPRKMVIKGPLTSLGTALAITPPPLLPTTTTTTSKTPGLSRRREAIRSTPSVETFNNVVPRQLHTARCSTPTRPDLDTRSAAELCVSRGKVRGCNSTNEPRGEVLHV